MSDPISNPPVSPEMPMKRGEVYNIVIRALNQKMGATKHKPTRRKLERVKWWLADDPAFRWESERLALNPHADLHPERSR